VTTTFFLFKPFKYSFYQSEFIHFYLKLSSLPKTSSL